MNENDRLDVLFNRSQLGDRKPSELLNEMRQLLDAYDAHNPQTNAVLKKLFLDKLPPEVRGILAASLETNLDSLATRADEVIAALAQNQFSQRPSTSQQLINQLFDQKLNKIIDQLQNSTPSQNFNLRPRHEQNSFASHSRPPPRRRYTNPRNTYRPRFQGANAAHSNYYNHGTSENQLCFYHHSFGPRARKCQPPCNWRHEEKAKKVSVGHRGSAVSNHQ